MMNRFSTICLIFPAFLLACSPLLAQDKARVSPHETVRAMLDGNEITVVYGRRFSKDRKAARCARSGAPLSPLGKRGGWARMKPPC